MNIQSLYNKSLKDKSNNLRLKELDDLELRFKEILRKENLNHLNIFIYIDKLKTKVKNFNAHATILENGSYEIGFCPQLLTVIDGLSLELTSKYKEYFTDIDKKRFYDKSSRVKLRGYIYEYFINHIFYHELYHILRGHIKYLHKTKSLSIILEFEESNNKILDNLYLEVDADKYASINSVIGSFEILENIRKLGFNFNEIFYIIFISMGELFYTFHLLNNEPLVRKGHPILYDRVTLFYHHFMETLNLDSIRNIFKESNINYDQINRLCELSIAIFTKKYKLEDLFYSCDVLNVQKGYDDFRFDVQLDSYAYNINDIEN